MTDDTKAVAVVILDKEYLVSCQEGERESLFGAVELVDSKMRALRASGKASGGERIAVMAALNIAHDYLECNRRQEVYSAGLGACVRRIQTKIAAALAGNGSLAR